MPKITHYLHTEIDVSQPVPELASVIAAVLQAWPGKERELLSKLKAEIQHTIDHLDEEDDKRGKPLRESSRQQQDQR